MVAAVTSLRSIFGVAPRGSLSPLLPLFTKLLHHVCSEKFPPMLFRHGGLTAPFVLVVVLRLVGYMVKDADDGVLEDGDALLRTSIALEGVGKKVAQFIGDNVKTNAVMAVAVETCQCMASCAPRIERFLAAAEAAAQEQVEAGSGQQTDRAGVVARIASSFASCKTIVGDLMRALFADGRVNLVYMGLSVMKTMTGLYAAQFQDVVLGALDAADESVRWKVTEILCRMANRQNVAVLISKMLSSLRLLSDMYRRGQLVEKMLLLAERFSLSDLWYVSTLNKIFEVAGESVSRHALVYLQQFIALDGSRGQAGDGALQLGPASSLLYWCLLEKCLYATDTPLARSWSRVLVAMAVWCIGEYGVCLLDVDTYIEPRFQVAILKERKAVDVVPKTSVAIIIMLVDLLKDDRLIAFGTGSQVQRAKAQGGAVSGVTGEDGGSREFDCAMNGAVQDVEVVHVGVSPVRSGAAFSNVAGGAGDDALGAMTADTYITDLRMWILWAVLKLLPYTAEEMKTGCITGGVPLGTRFAVKKLMGRAGTVSSGAAAPWSVASGGAGAGAASNTMLEMVASMVYNGMCAVSKQSVDAAMWDKVIPFEASSVEMECDASLPFLQDALLEAHAAGVLEFVRYDEDPVALIDTVHEASTLEDGEMQLGTSTVDLGAAVKEMQLGGAESQTSVSSLDSQQGHEASAPSSQQTPFSRQGSEQVPSCQDDAVGKDATATPSVAERRSKWSRRSAGRGSARRTGGGSARRRAERGSATPQSRKGPYVPSTPDMYSVSPSQAAGRPRHDGVRDPLDEEAAAAARAHGERVAASVALAERSAAKREAEQKMLAAAFFS